MGGFETADLMSAFVKRDGSVMDLAIRMSPEFDLKSELSRGRVEVLTKTDCAALRDPERGNIRRVSTTISRNNLSGIIKIGPTRNRPKIGV